MKQLKVFVITQELSPSFYIRHFEPLSYLEKQGKLKFSFKTGKRVNIKDLQNHDIYIFNRVNKDFYYTIFNFLKIKNKRIIYDTDDYILDTPSYSHFKINDNIKKNIKYFINNSDVFTVSTENLKQEFRNIRKDSIVIENSVNIQKYGANNKHLNALNKSKEFNIIITFSDNISLVTKTKRDFEKALDEILILYPNVKIILISPVSLNLKNISRVEHIKNMEYGDYKNYLKNNPIHLSLSPIGITRSNTSLYLFLNCKSNIKFIDYASAKILGIYSNSSIYKDVVKEGKTGFLVDNSYEGWVKKIQYVIDNYKDLVNAIENAYLYCKNNYDIKNKAKIYFDVVSKVNKIKKRNYNNLLLEFLLAVKIQVHYYIYQVWYEIKKLIK